MKNKSADEKLFDINARIAQCIYLLINFGFPAFIIALNKTGYEISQLDKQEQIRRFTKLMNEIQVITTQCRATGKTGKWGEWP